MQRSRFPGRDPEWEKLRQNLNDISDHEGNWQIKARLVHNPTPWSNGLVTPSLIYLDRPGRDNELLLIEIGYRAAWRMIVETHDGHTDRRTQLSRQRCVDNGHQMRASDRLSYADWTHKCLNCGHVMGKPGCRKCLCGRCDLKVVFI